VKRFGRVGFFSIVLLGGGSSQYVHAQPAAAETLTGGWTIRVRRHWVCGSDFGGGKGFPRCDGAATRCGAPNDGVSLREGWSSSEELCVGGIHVLAPERFDEFYQTLEHSQEKVQRMEGCIGFAETMQDVARKIRSGAYDGDVKPVKKS